MRATTAGAACVARLEVDDRRRRHARRDRRIGRGARAGAPPTANRAAADRPRRPRGRTASCSADRVIAELEHLAEHRDLSRRARFVRDHFERAAQRRRARVVGIVDERDAAAQPIARRRADRPAAAARSRRRSSSSGTPHSSATAVAASTFDRLPRPSSGVSMTRSPAGVATSRAHAVDAAVLDRRARARSRSPASPNVTVRPANAARARHHARIVGVADQHGRRRPRARGSRPWHRRSRRRTQRSRGARRRRWSTRGRPARQSRPAC